MFLPPEVRQLLDMLGRVEAPRLQEQPLEFARRNFHKLLYAYRGEAPPIAEARTLSLPRRELAGGPLQARLYTPLEAMAPLPVLLWLHGGGWTLGDLAGYDVLCRQFCAQAGCAVLALDYRLAPENQFPAALDDACYALAYLQREAAVLGLDAQRIAIGGDSAGGNLAAVASLLARERVQAGQAAALRLQVLVYPTTDQTSTRASHERYAEGYFLDRASIEWFQRNYLPAEADHYDWRASPLLAPDLRAAPPALVLCAEHDPLTDDARAYAEALQAAGVPTQYSEYAGMIHGFLTMDRILPDAARAQREIAAALRQAFA